MNAGQVIQVVFSLLFIVALLLAMSWIARRSGWIQQRLNRADLKILGTLRLGARSSIALIEVEGTHLVVGVTAQQITLLHARPANTASPATTPASDFSEALGKVVSRP